MCFPWIEYIARTISLKKKHYLFTSQYLRIACILINILFSSQPLRWFEPFIFRPLNMLPTIVFTFKELFVEQLTLSIASYSKINNNRMHHQRRRHRNHRLNQHQKTVSSEWMRYSFILRLNVSFCSFDYLANNQTHQMWRTAHDDSLHYKICTVILFRLFSAVVVSIFEKDEKATSLL